MFYIIYKITNNINNKQYIGAHKTDNINDNYMGSGKLLKRAILKYGISNFTKEIIAVFDNSEEMYLLESVLVNTEYVNRDDTYNLKIGGAGGFDHINNNIELSKIKSQRATIAAHTSLELKYGPDWGKVTYQLFRKHAILEISSEQRKEYNKKRSDEYYKKFGRYPFEGKKHSQETKDRISESASITSKGDRNSQYGTCWIHNNVTNTKIRKDELSKFVIAGWILGRKMSLPTIKTPPI